MQNNELIFGKDIFKDEMGHYYTNQSIIQGILFSPIYSSIKETPSTYADGFSGNTDTNNTGNYADMSELNNIATGNGAWDIQKACQWIEENSYPYYIQGKCGKCAKHVRSAIDIGFGTNPNGNDSYTGVHGRPEWAWKYINFLPKIGFKHIGTVHRNQMHLFTPHSGDIAVYQKNGNPNVPGHICMYSERIGKWISDYKQNSMFAYQGTTQADIFRFT